VAGDGPKQVYKWVLSGKFHQSGFKFDPVAIAAWLIGIRRK